MNLPFFIAKRYLFSQKGAFSSFIIRLGMVATALSVATMVLSVAFISGFKHEIRGKLFSFWGNVHITPYTPNASTIITPQPVQRDAKLEQEIRQIPHVVSIDPFAVRPAIIKTSELMEGIQLKGVNDAYKLPQGVDLEGATINYGDTSYAKEVLLSQTTADRMNIKSGDEIQLYFLEPGSTFPRIRKVRVSGIFHTGMDEVDRHYALCDIRLLQRINNWEADEMNGYQVSLDNDKYSDTVSTLIFNNYLQPPLTTNTMRDIFPNVYDWLQLNDVNAAVILIIMAVVAIINLAVALMILIVEQARMIGVLKTQGMTQGAMGRIFLYHATLIAGTGIILGNVLALIICFIQAKTGFLALSEASYYVHQVPVKLYWWQLLLIDTVTLALCILCMWLPSLYIRRIQPARVLQFK